MVGLPCRCFTTARGAREPASADLSRRHDDTKTSIRHVLAVGGRRHDRFNRLSAAVFREGRTRASTLALHVQ